MESSSIATGIERIAARYLRISIGIILVLAALSIGAFAIAEPIDSGPVYFLLQRFFSDIELSVPTLYNYALLAINFSILAALALAVRASGGRDFGHWLALTVIMLLLTYDEAAQVHEDIAQRLAGALPESPFLQYAWTPVGAVVVIVVALVFIPFLRRLPRDIARLMFAAGAIYVGGALGVETIGGWIHFHYGQGLGYQAVSTLEESMEMIGMTLFGYALLRHLADVAGRTVPEAS